MVMKQVLMIIVALVCISSLLLIRCVSPNAGNGTQTGNPTVASMLYNPGGSPAAHAKVRFYPIHYNPRTGVLTKAIAAVVDSTTTDAKGNYAAKLDTGTYNVLAAGDSGVVYQDSIKVVKDSTVHPPADTLGAPGSIKGIVRLQPGDDARTVFIIFMGTNILNMPDDAIGNFTAANMAQGTYRVRILTTLDAYVPKDTVLNVTAGQVDTLTHDIVLQYTGIPVPSGLKISYDTLKQIVALSWNKPTTGRGIKGYNIYRQYMGSTDSSLVKIKSTWTDTVFYDSTGIQDQTYAYVVAAVDTSNTEGVKCISKQVKISSYLSLDTAFSSIGGGIGQFAYPADISIVANGDIFIADQDNNRIQVFDSTLHFKKQIGVGTLNKPYKITVNTLGQVFAAEYDTIFFFDTTGALSNKIITSSIVTDFAAEGTDLFVITNGDSISVYAYNGTKKRTWKCGSINSSNYVVAGDSGKIMVNNDDLKKVITYDSIGTNLSAITTTAYMYGLAFDLSKRRLFTVYLNSLDNEYVLHVTDENNVELTHYRIPTNNPGEGIALELQKNGTVFLILSTSNKIIKLKSLLP
jgi:hypothetical protein